MCLAHSWLNVNMLHPFERFWLNNREKCYQFASSCAEDQAESFVGKAQTAGDIFSEILGKGENCRQEYVVSQGNILLWQSRRPSAEQKMEHAARCFSHMPRGDWQGWMHLKKLVQCGRTKPRLDGKELSIRTQEAEVGFVCRLFKFNPKFP